MMIMSDEEYWWDAGRGCGTGRAISWKAWMLTLAYALIVTAAAWFVLPRSLVAFLAVMLSATTLFLVVVANRTRGGLHLRWPTGRCAASPPSTPRTRTRRRS